MKTFETERGNMPEGATHYIDESSDMYFCWVKGLDTDEFQIMSIDTMDKWVISDQFRYINDGITPIPQQEEQKVEWKNGDECIYQGEIYVYQCVASWDSDACILSGKSRNSESLIDAWSDELSKPESPEEKEKRLREEAVKEMFSYWSEDEEAFVSGDEDDQWVKRLMYTLYDEGYQKKEKINENTKQVPLGY